VVVFSALLYIAAVYLILPTWKEVSGGPELRVVIVRPVAGRGFGRGWVFGLILWLLEFQQGFENFVGGHVRFVIQVAVIGEYLVYKVSFCGFEDGQYRPKHVFVRYIVTKKRQVTHLCLTTYHLPSFTHTHTHTHNRDDTIPR